MFPSLFHYRFLQNRLVGVNGWGISIALGWMVCTSEAQAADSPTQRLFTKHCQKCHSGEKPKGKFDITKAARTRDLIGELAAEGFLDYLDATYKLK